MDLFGRRQRFLLPVIGGVVASCRSPYLRNDISAELWYVVAALPAIRLWLSCGAEKLNPAPSLSHEQNVSIISSHSNRSIFQVSPRTGWSGTIYNPRYSPILTLPPPHHFHPAFYTHTPITHHTLLHQTPPSLFTQMSLKNYVTQAESCPPKDKQLGHKKKLISS